MKTTGGKDSAYQARWYLTSRSRKACALSVVSGGESWELKQPRNGNLASRRSTDARKARGAPSRTRALPACGRNTGMSGRRRTPSQISSTRESEDMHCTLQVVLPNARVPDSCLLACLLSNFSKGGSANDARGSAIAATPPASPCMKWSRDVGEPAPAPQLRTCSPTMRWGLNVDMI